MRGGNLVEIAGFCGKTACFHQESLRENRPKLIDGQFGRCHNKLQDHAKNAVAVSRCVPCWCRQISILSMSLSSGRLDQNVSVARGFRTGMLFCPFVSDRASVILGV